MASANAGILTKRLADAYFTGTYKFLLVSAAPSEGNLDAFDFRDDIVNEVADAGKRIGNRVRSVQRGVRANPTHCVQSFGE